MNLSERINAAILLVIVVWAVPNRFDIYFRDKP